MAIGVTGEQSKFMGETFINIFFNRKERKLKAFFMGNAQNLFRTDWMEEFDLFNVPMNTFCYKIDGTTTSLDKQKNELKIKLPEIFRKGLDSVLKLKQNSK